MSSRLDRSPRAALAARQLRDGFLLAFDHCVLSDPGWILPRAMPRAGRAALERDLYQQLLELRGHAEPRSVIGATLELLVAAVGAQCGYVELYPDRGDLDARWTISHNCTPEDEAHIRAVTSRGIVSAALAAGTTLHVPYASLDDRFASQPSVRDRRLEAVLCVPLGTVASGVVYLEGRSGEGPFADDDIKLVENVARYMWPSLDPLVREVHRRGHDPTLPFRHRLRLEGVIGRSAALARVFEHVEPYAPLDVTLLITGASGTGKTQLAHAVHANSHRRTGPFVELNCAAIPEGLIESELFGTVPGAFPGARRNPGKVEAAEGGTLFLDEIVEIPFAAQGKLLQLLQSRQYHALASNRLTTANVRLIAATNADLATMVLEKRFREDLFYRINVVGVRMPSLSERADDIAVLVDELVIRIAHEHHLAPLRASEQFRRVMETRDWPGNIRQLRTQIESALIRAHADGSPQVEVRHLPGATPEQQPTTFHEATRAYQRELLRRELVAQGWNVSASAARLDVTRAHVYNLIHQFDLRREGQ
jgi:Nif-specific regulatory protein